MWSMAFLDVDVSGWIDREIAQTMVRVVLLVAIGLPLAGLVARLLHRAALKRFSQQSAMVARKAAYYTAMVVLIITVLNEFGFHLGTLLGAAGIAGIAIGFAAQTSVSNIISGLFLISEKPFAVGDIVTVGQTTGVVLSIDLLSAKVRTFDNHFVRIPNETIIKTEVSNLTHFPIRRVDISVGVAYKEDIVRVEGVLREVAAVNPLVLDEPRPLFIFKNFGDSALECLFAAWCIKTDFLATKNSLMTGIKQRFDAERIEIPFPHRTLYAGSVTDPFPVSLAGQSIDGGSGDPPIQTEEGGSEEEGH